MKRLIIACSLLLSGALFANTEIPANAQNIEIEISDNKEVDRLFTNFGTQRVNSFSYANYYLTNTGSQTLYFRDARIYGAGFYARHNCRTLPPGARCTFTTEFRPFYEGFHSGQFRLEMDPGYMVIVDLQGHAVRY